MKTLSEMSISELKRFAKQCNKEGKNVTGEATLEARLPHLIVSHIYSIKSKDYTCVWKREISRFTMKETECDYLNNYGITLYVGGCGEKGKWFRRKAHAHNDSKYPMFGSICVLSERRLYNEDGTPSNLLKHELAHMLNPNRGHDQRWAATLRDLGGRVATSYYSHLK